MNAMEETNAADAAVKPTRLTRIDSATPMVSIYEDADGYTLEAEMPGASKDSVHVTVANGELVLMGSKSQRFAGTLIHGETAPTDYSRVFDLDPAVETSKITAKIDQGLLTVRLPKTQESKPRRISIEG